uniref:Mitochondria-eating protein C-terminal domain-containing protein n=1 Tax=Pinctada fucata TaxID=50426 RepID=A0A194AN19_PINFU
MIQNNDDIKSQYESCIKFCPKYTRKCLELCWYMSIQDPPIFMDFSAKSGANYDATNWREYTKKGTEVDFMVWPALFLHKDGPLLSKGVLQPKDVITVTSEAQRDVETPSGILIDVDN